jgi:hypothetical protein
MTARISHVSLSAVAAALAISACGASAPAARTAATHGATVTPTTAPSPTPTLTCKQQGDQWKTDHAALIRRFERALTPFSNGTVTSAQARDLARTAQEMTDTPLPACADPKGYYTQAMANLSTAGTAAEGGGMLSELGAITPLENADTAIHELEAEMMETMGSSKL